MDGPCSERTPNSCLEEYLKTASAPLGWQLAWRCIVENPWYQQDLYRHASNQLVAKRVPLDQIDDVCQEVSLLLGATLRDSEVPEFSSLAEFAAWIEHFNRHACREVVAVQDGLEVSSLPNDPVAAENFVDEAVELELLLDELPKPQRSAVRLRLLGYKIRQICSLLNLEERAVYRRLERGFAKLQRRISDLVEHPRQ